MKMVFIVALALGCTIPVAKAQELNLETGIHYDEDMPQIDVPYEARRFDPGIFGAFLGESEEGDYLILETPEWRLGEGWSVSAYELRVRCPVAPEYQQCSRFYDGARAYGFVARRSF